MHRVFVKYSIEKLEQYTSRIDVCLDKLTNEQIWARNADPQNAVGNLVLHLSGNVRQWLLSGVGGEPDTRDRDAEFAARGNVDALQLKKRLHDSVDAAVRLLKGLPEGRLTEPMQCQGYKLSVLEGIYHVVEHFAYHAGQIIFATKLFTAQDLGFYRHLNKPVHAEKTP